MYNSDHPNLIEFSDVFKRATEETSTRILKRLLTVLKEGAPEDNGGLEELGYAIAGKLAERGELGDI